MWLNLAASRGSGANQAEYAETRDAVVMRMAPEQIASARRPSVGRAGETVGPDYRKFLPLDLRGMIS